MTPASPTSPRLARAAPRIHYQRLAAGEAPPADALMVVGFGVGARLPGAFVQVALEPLAGGDLVEVWSAQGAVSTGSAGALRFRNDDHFLVGCLEVREEDHGDIAAATAFAYRQIARFLAECGFPRLLRTWNYFDSINLGEGNAERYRGFCSGRVAGLATLPVSEPSASHPAATVIGSHAGQRLLQVYWLSGREAGMALENPRQVSAFEYPREYGETAPTFSRAMLISQRLLLISGTASIVGHASRHAGNVGDQTREILKNLDSLLARAHQQAPALSPQMGPNTLIKGYVRRRADLPVVTETLRARLPAGAPLLLLLGDVCRAELLVEFDCIQSAA